MVAPFFQGRALQNLLFSTWRALIELGCRVYNDTTSDGCTELATGPRFSVESGVPTASSSVWNCQMWARPLSGGRWAMALYNRNPKQTTVKGLFSALPPQPKLTIEGENVHAGAAPTELMVRDVWAGKDLGSHRGSVSATLDAHATTVLLLSPQ